MARKTEFIEGRPVWMLEICEETVFLDVWLRVRNRIPPSEMWVIDLEHHLFEKGDFLSQRNLEHVNRHNKRIFGESVEFMETNPSDYIRKGSNELRVKERLHLKRQLEGMDKDVRNKYIAQALTDMSDLEPSHHTFEEWKRGRSLKQQEERGAARINHPSKLIHMSHPKEHEHAANVVSHIPPDTAIELLKHTTDIEIKNLLVRMAIASYGTYSSTLTQSAIK